MVSKVLQIGYEPERDRLTWDGWDIHCGQGMDVLFPDRSMEAHGGLYPSSTMMMDGICLGILVCLQLACGQGSGTSKKTDEVITSPFLFEIT